MRPVYGTTPPIPLATHRWSFPKTVFRTDLLHIKLSAISILQQQRTAGSGPPSRRISNQSNKGLRPSHPCAYDVRARPGRQGLNQTTGEQAGEEDRSPL